MLSAILQRLLRGGVQLWVKIRTHGRHFVSFLEIGDFISCVCILERLQLPVLLFHGPMLPPRTFLHS